MTTIQKATKATRERYKGLYPLYGLATVRCTSNLVGKIVYIEDLRNEWSAPDPVWEIRAPDGYHFGLGELTHGLLCHSLRDVRDRLSCAELEPCTHGCGCGCEYDDPFDPFNENQNV